MKKILLAASLLISTVFADIKLNEVPEEVLLEKDLGGLISGEKFSTSIIKEKVYLFFYIDPDVKDLNNEFTEFIKAKKYDRSKYNSIVVINLDATWIPNFAIESGLEKKQKNFPHTIYVKDNKKVFVNKWNLKDDDYNVLLFNKNGELLFKKSGLISKEDTSNIVKLIEDRIK